MPIVVVTIKVADARLVTLPALRTKLKNLNPAPYCSRAVELSTELV